MEETEPTQLPGDVVREILLRVPTVDDVAALFRCAVTCKQWRAIVADLSFLRQHWPENACHPSSLLGFFDKRYGNQDMTYFYPTSPGSVLGAQRRSLVSFIVSGAPPGGILDDAVMLAARGGLLLVRLAGDSLRLAVCDLLAGTCDVLPPLECRVSYCGCAILTREDCCSSDGQTPSTGYSAFFKVLAMVIGHNDQDCNLYTFLSSEPKWSKPRKCFDEVSLSHRDPFALRIQLGANRAIVCRGIAYWLGSYSPDPWTLPRYLIFGVNAKTGQILLIEVSIPANQLAAVSHFGVTLSVTVHGNLSLFHLQKEGLRLNMWTRGDDGAWLHARAIDLKPPGQEWNPVCVAILSGEKSGALFMADVDGHAHKTNMETGVMEDVMAEMFQDGLSIKAVPIEMDWPAFFMTLHAYIFLLRIDESEQRPGKDMIDNSNQNCIMDI